MPPTRPDEPTDQVVERYQWETPEPGVTTERWIVALSFLRYPHGFTGTVASHRRRGIARAVKMETLAQAIELDVESVRTDNDVRNVAVLHINEELGYALLPAFATYEKEF
jgi:RimJ/RimL family protein N-acetyltransferase